MQKVNFHAPAKIVGIIAPDEWILEVQDWPDGHWIGHSNGIVVIERKHILGNAKVGDNGSLSFDKDRDLLWQFIPFISS